MYCGALHNEKDWTSLPSSPFFLISSKENSRETEMIRKIEYHRGNRKNTSSNSFIYVHITFFNLSALPMLLYVIFISVEIIFCYVYFYIWEI